MPYVEIDVDGVTKKFEPDPSYWNLPMDKRAAAIATIGEQYREMAKQQQQTSQQGVDEAGFTPPTLSDANAVSGPAKDELKYRSSFLPLGKTKSGDVVPAIPQFLEGPRQTVMDLLEGKRTADQITGKEIFELGGLLANPSAAAGSGKAIAAVAAGKTPPATPSVETAGALRTIAKNAETGFADNSIEKPNVLTTPELKQQSQAAYKAADDAGIQIKPDAFRNMVASILPEVKKAGFDKDIQPAAAAALRRLGTEIENGSAPTLSELDILRQVAKGAASKPDANERRISRIITGKMDDFVSNLKPEDLISGDSEAGNAALLQARQLWTQYIKGDKIDQLFEKAANNSSNYSAGGYELALRNQFKALANNPNRMRQFSADEQDAIKNVVRGDLTQNTMTKLGKFSPTAGFFGALVSGEIALQALTNPKLLLIPGIAGIAKFYAGKLREGRANAVSELVRGGKPMADYQSALATQRASEGNTFGSAIQRGGLTGLGTFGGLNSRFGQ